MFHPVQGGNRTALVTPEKGSQGKTMSGLETLMCVCLALTLPALATYLR
jgi:hypothetical protein